MKKTAIPYGLLAILLMGILVISCTKDVTKMSTPRKERMISGEWKISYFWDKDKDETHDYNGYTFDFQKSGKLIAKGDGQEFTGKWFIDEESDDDNGKDDDLVINIQGNDKMEEISDDWDLKDLTDEKIILEDQSGSGGTEKLHFKK